ncbi:MAG TPA: CheR family methyltransferase [Kofleriaceae bacterium]|nr:CheR family methyltransferase [Kofleriaceae bacterium]
MTTASHSREIEALLDALDEVGGVDYRGWSSAFLAGRVAEQVAAEGLGGVPELTARVRLDRGVLERLVIALARGPVHPFTDVEWARALRRDVVPRLRTYPSVNIWHPGCGTGAEVYTTAIVLREEGLLERARIYATDVSEIVLASARRALIEEWPEEVPRRYREAGGTQSLDEYYQRVGTAMGVRPLLRDAVVFAVHSFATDASFNEFHLIVCRQQIERFGPAMQRRTFAVLTDSLCRFGFLAVGRDDMPGRGPIRDSFQVVRPEVDLYRRVP